MKSTTFAKLLIAFFGLMFLTLSGAATKASDIAAKEKGCFTTTEINAEKRLTKLVLCNGANYEMRYFADGRLESVNSARGTATFLYSGDSATPYMVRTKNGAHLADSFQPATLKSIAVLNSQASRSTTSKSLNESNYIISPEPCDECDPMYEAIYTWAYTLTTEAWFHDNIETLVCTTGPICIACFLSCGVIFDPADCEYLRGSSDFPVCLSRTSNYRVACVSICL